MDNSMVGERTAKGFNMVLVSGEPFFPLCPEPNDIYIEDIAHSLAMQCRFNGHTTQFYSVAQHSALVASILPHRLKLEGLLHDAAEAYIGDLIRPVKLMCDDWNEIDQKVDAACRKRFGLADKMPDEVKLADNILAVTEKRDLIADCPNVQWGKMPTPLPDKIAPLSPLDAKALFLDAYDRYTQGK